jgi:hypothetical protein
MKSICIPLPKTKWEPILKSGRRSKIVPVSDSSESSDSSDSDTAINKQQNDQQQSVTNHVFYLKL